MTLSNRELWVFMLGADVMSSKGNEGTIQIIVKYALVCRKLGITPLSPQEMAAFRLEVITTIGTAAQSMQGENIWEKRLQPMEGEE